MTNNELQRPNFYHIPTVVAAKVNPHEAFVFAVIYWFTKLKEGRCFASNERIAEALPYKSSPLSVANALTALERAGFIKRIFVDESRRIRSEVVSLVDYTVSPTDDTGIIQGLNQVSSTGEQNKKRLQEKIQDSTGQSPGGKSIPSSKVSFQPVDLELATLLYELILDNTPTFKPPNLDAWAEHVRLMRERDERTPEQIRFLINWAQNDTFWQGNILSTQKLREKFDTLVTRVKREHSEKNKKSNNYIL